MFGLKFSPFDLAPSCSPLYRERASFRVRNSALLQQVYPPSLSVPPHLAFSTGQLQATLPRSRSCVRYVSQRRVTTALLRACGFYVHVGFTTLCPLRLYEFKLKVDRSAIPTFCSTDDGPMWLTGFFVLRPCAVDRQTAPVRVYLSTYNVQGHYPFRPRSLIVAPSTWKLVTVFALHKIGPPPATVMK